METKHTPGVKNVATENIQVYLRMRPPNKREVEAEEGEIWALNKNSIKLNADKFNNLAKQRKMPSVAYTKACFFSISIQVIDVDGCFGSQATNKAIYQDNIGRIVESSLAGINGTLFLYGQTGAGKTYTMMGDYSEEIANAKSSGAPTPTSRGNRTPIRKTPQASARVPERSRTPLSKCSNNKSCIRIFLNHHSHRSYQRSDFKHSNHK